MKRTSRLRASLVSRWKTFYAAVPLVRLRPRGTPARSLRRDRTSRPARHRFDARLDARACRGRGSVSEPVVEVGSPGWARTSDPLINSQSQAHTQLYESTLAAPETRLLLVQQVA